MRYTIHMNTLKTKLLSLYDTWEVEPEKLDRDIRDTIRGVGLSILSIALGLAKIKREKLFTALGFKNITAYIEDLAKSTKNDRGNIFSWLKIGETYIKYHDDLEKIGYTEGDSPSKLAYLEKALAHAPKEEVYDKLLTMTYRKFKAFAKSGGQLNKEEEPLWEIRGNILYIKGQRAIILKKDLEEQVNNMLLGAIRAACRALEKKGVIAVVHLKNQRDMRLFIPRARKLRARIEADFT